MFPLSFEKENGDNSAAAARLGTAGQMVSHNGCRRQPEDLGFGGLL